ncbi:hypothetical protein BC835DRAFT_167049 [Cytidiella melzeri]|nr:hypothetical protein BC835DRAFT_167049 [Cytidiella melzeri]
MERDVLHHECCHNPWSVRPFCHWLSTIASLPSNQNLLSTSPEASAVLHICLCPPSRSLSSSSFWWSTACYLWLTSCSSCHLPENEVPRQVGAQYSPSLSRVLCRCLDVLTMIPLSCCCSSLLLSSPLLTRYQGSCERSSQNLALLKALSSAL